jgi:hypothetical protein
MRLFPTHGKEYWFYFSVIFLGGLPIAIVLRPLQIRTQKSPHRAASFVECLLVALRRRPNPDAQGPLSGVEQTQARTVPTMTHHDDF